MSESPKQPRFRIPLKVLLAAVLTGCLVMGAIVRIGPLIAWRIAHRGDNFRSIVAQEFGEISDSSDWRSHRINHITIRCPPRFVNTKDASTEPAALVSGSIVIHLACVEQFGQIENLLRAHDASRSESYVTWKLRVLSTETSDFSWTMSAQEFDVFRRKIESRRGMGEVRKIERHRVSGGDGLLSVYDSAAYYERCIDDRQVQIHFSLSSVSTKEDLGWIRAVCNSVEVQRSEEREWSDQGE
jgi:hypothetical protein